MEQRSSPSSSINFRAALVMSSRLSGRRGVSSVDALAADDFDEGRFDFFSGDVVVALLSIFVMVVATNDQI
jgi:hypothetical protein